MSFRRRIDGDDEGEEEDAVGDSETTVGGERDDVGWGEEDDAGGRGRGNGRGDALGGGSPSLYDGTLWACAIDCPHRHVLPHDRG